MHAQSSARKRNSRRPRGASRLTDVLRWSVAGGLLLLCGGLGLAAWSASAEGQAALLRLGFDDRYEEVQRNLDLALTETLPHFADEADGGHRWLPDGIDCRVVAVDSSRSLWEAQLRVGEAVGEVGGRILWSERLLRPERGLSGEAAETVRLDVGVAGRPTHTLLLHLEGVLRPHVDWGAGSRATAWDLLAADEQRPTVALMIDDWGNFDNEITSGLLALDAPLTMSVMPGLAWSRRFALAATELALPEDAAVTSAAAPTEAGLRRERLDLNCPVEVSLGGSPAKLAARRREVWLHLPMEPEGYPAVNPGSYAIMKGMSRNEIDVILDRALAGLPGVGGVNNHMGSAATADVPTMQRLMKALAERDLIYLDSMTTAASVAAETAGREGLPVLRNRIFLDQAHSSPAQVRQLLARLVRSAESTGFAVGIGHPYRETLAVLREEIPRLQAAGVRFVTVSELLALRERRQ